jgi:hypothetical protein
MLTFVDKSNLDSNIPLLQAHKIWELEYAFSSPSELDHELIKRFIKSIKVEEHPLNIIEERKKLIDNNL